MHKMLARRALDGMRKRRKDASNLDLKHGEALPELRKEK
jgi:hypothetical protein